MPDADKRTGSPQSLSGLIPFLKPYRSRIALAVLFLVLAAGATLAFPWALRELIDGGLQANSSLQDRGAQLVALRGHFFDLFLVAVALGLFSAARFFTVSWLGERITADLRNTVYAKVLRQSPAFFETTQTGEVLSRLTADTTLVQTVVGSSLSMGLRNGVMDKPHRDGDGFGHLAAHRVARVDRRAARAQALSREPRSCGRQQRDCI
jgi:ATP-binding cassette, subfamily B, bacterial